MPAPAREIITEVLRCALDLLKTELIFQKRSYAPQQPDGYRRSVAPSPTLRSGLRFADYFLTRLFCWPNRAWDDQADPVEPASRKGRERRRKSSWCRWDPARVNLGRAGPPIIQRPWGSARSPPLAGSGEAKKTKDPAERRSGDGSARHEQPFHLLEPEAGVARPLVDLDPRRAVAQDCFQHGALHSAHAPNPQPVRQCSSNMRPCFVDTV
jgi:hypothetical protein